MATSDAAAYYTLVSRLRRAGLAFSSSLPGLGVNCDLVLTTAREATELGMKALAVEDLDEDPTVFKGQVMARLGGGSEVLLVGVDPGMRTGFAAFYGHTKLASSTFDSVAEVGRLVGALASKVPSGQLLVRIGDGSKEMALEVAESVQDAAPRATIEVVNESGTSAGSQKAKGMQKDQAAAVKIAFRKGEPFERRTTRIPG